LTGKLTLSKHGNARLRYAFWMADQGAVRMRENTFRQKYARYIKSDPQNPDRKRKAPVPWLPKWRAWPMA
jgi:hypothetical protein